MSMTTNSIANTLGIDKDKFQQSVLKLAGSQSLDIGQADNNGFTINNSLGTALLCKGSISQGIKLAKRNQALELRIAMYERKSPLHRSSVFDITVLLLDQGKSTSEIDSVFSSIEELATVSNAGKLGDMALVLLTATGTLSGLSTLV